MTTDTQTDPKNRVAAARDDTVAKPRPLRVALVGCGAIAEQMHLPVLAGHDGIELTALVDRDEGRARRLADGYGVKHVVRDADDLVEGSFDAAILATPPFHHAPGSIALMRRGIHVLVEKPMALNLAEAEEMCRVADEHGVALAVGFFRRLYPSIRLMKALVDSGDWGPVQSFAAEGGGMYSWTAATLGNMRRELAGGGVLIDYGSHLLDLLFYLFPESTEKGSGTICAQHPSGRSGKLYLTPFPTPFPAEVLDYRDNSLGGIEADCSLRLQLTDCGRPIEGTVELARTRELGNCIRVECERATLRFDFTERFRVRVEPREVARKGAKSAKKKQDRSSSDLAVFAPLRENLSAAASHSNGDDAADAVMEFDRSVPQGYWLQAGWRGDDESLSWYDTFRLQIDDWLDAIRTGREPLLSGRSALATVRVIDACYRNRRPMAEPWVWEGIGARRAEGGGQRAAAQIGDRSQESEVGSRESGVGNRETATVSQPSTFNAQPFPLPTPYSLLPTPSSSRRVLITGATGFIGSRVAEILHLRDGWNVRALVHNPGNASRLARLPIELVQGDLKDDEQVRRMVDGCDAVVHCAIGTEWGQRKEIFAVTVDGTRRLAEAALAAGTKRFVHLSTISIYGDDLVMTGTIDESTPVRPARGSEYGESKAAAERAVLDAARRGLTAAVLRPARVYGPHSRIFINRPIQAIAERRFRWISSPDLPADMVYVDNIVDAIVRSLAAPADAVRGEVFTISDGNDITWRAFYDYFAQRLDLVLDAPVIQRDGAQEVASASGWNPMAWFRGIKRVVTSAEFKRLGRRVLDTPPLGSFPRWTLDTFPSIERAARRMVGADGSLPIYRRGEIGPAKDWVQMGSGGALVSIAKARRVLGYDPPVSMERGLDLTCQWVQHARLV